MRAVAVAPGKVILTGEHFVVQGAPAIVAAVKLYSTVTVTRTSNPWTEIVSTSLGQGARFWGRRSRPIRGGSGAMTALKPIYVLFDAVSRYLDVRERGTCIRIDSEIPVGVGLGSSAAIAVSTSAALSRLYHDEIDKDALMKLTYESEEMIHGTPSGIDQTITTYGGIISYIRGKTFRHIRPRMPLPLVIGNTGKTRSTGTMVAKVRKFLDQDRVFKTEIMKSALSISRRAVHALRIGDLQQLGQMMNSNQELLHMVGASTIELDSLILAARRAGALGAKMTGAGGGGCMIALSHSGRERQIARAIEAVGGTTYTVSIDKVGVRAWLSN